MTLPLSSTAWRVDRRVGLISIAMWLGTAFRVFPALTPSQNAQSLVAIASMLLIVVVWPSFALEHYQRWRLVAVSFLRVFLVALPYNFSTHVFDAIAPAVATGRLAVVANVFQAFLAVRVALLTFTSLGWRVPFRWHLLLQSVNVGLLVMFGLHPYCDSKLLSSPELQGAAQSVHKAMNLFASVFLPNVAVTSPQGLYAQRVAFLLFCWFILGWLLPTLLLFYNTDADPPPAAPPQGQRPRFWLLSALSVPANKAVLALERGLSTLCLPGVRRPARGRADDDAAAGIIPAGDGDELLSLAGFVLAWCVTLLSTWMGACFLAGPGGPLMRHVTHHA